MREKPTPNSEDEVLGPVEPPSSGDSLLDRLPIKGDELTHHGEIARGGMGAIEKVRDETLNRDLALKVILPERAEDARYVHRFLEEAQVTAQLDHPGVVPVQQLGRQPDGRLYFTMKLVKGRTLTEIMGLVRSRREHWTRTRAIELFVRVCETLAFAHQRGVVHRDLKPANIMVGNFGEVYVMDWGLAKVLSGKEKQDEAPVATVRSTDNAESGDGEISPIATMAGDIIGTPVYMSLEQAMGSDVDGRADVYAVGAMLYELLAGHAPYREKKRSAVEVVVAKLAGPPVPLRKLKPDLPGEIHAICEKAMERDLAQRYQSAEELAQELRDFIEGRVVRAYRTGAVIELRKWITRNRALAGAIGAALVLLVTGLIVSVYLTGEARRREHEAQREAYRSGIQVAAADVASHNLPAARERLSRLPADLRGWEWRHLKSRLEQSLGEIDADRVVEQSDGRIFLARGQDGQFELEVFALDLDSGVESRIGSVPHDRSGLGNGDFLEIEDPAFFALIDPASLEIILRFDRSGYRCWCNTGKRIGWDTGDGPRVFDAGTGERWSYKMDRTSPLAFSPDGRLLALQKDAVPYDVVLMEVATGRIAATLRLSRPKPEVLVAFSPDGMRIAVTEGNFVSLFDTATGEPAAWETAGGHTDAVSEVQFSPDGKLLATGSKDRTIRILDAATGRTLRVLAGHRHAVGWLRFTRDGDKLLSRDEEPRNLVWDVRSARDPYILRGHRSFVYPVAYTPDGKRIVSGGWDGFQGQPGCLRVWDAATGEPVAAWGAAHRIVESLALSPDGSRIYTCGRGSRDGYGTSTLEVWSASTGERLSGPEGELNLVRAGPQGRFLAAAEYPNAKGHVIHLIDAATFATVGTLLHTERVDQLEFSPDGRRLAAVAGGGAIRIWDTASHDLQLSIPAWPARRTGSRWDQFGRITFSRDGRRLLLAAPDGTIRVLDARDGHAKAVMRGHGDFVYDVLESFDGTRIFSGGNDRRILIWDAETFEMITDLTGHESYVYSLALSKDGKTLLSGSGDGTIRVWETVPVRARQNAIAMRRRLVAELEPKVRAMFGKPDDVVREIEATLTGRKKEVALQIALGIATSDQ